MGSWWGCCYLPGQSGEKGIAWAQALRQGQVYFKEEQGVWVGERQEQGQGQIPDSWCLETMWKKRPETWGRGRVRQPQGTGPASPRLLPASRSLRAVSEPQLAPKAPHSDVRHEDGCGRHAEGDWTGELRGYIYTIKTRMGSEVM